VILVQKKITFFFVFFTLDCKVTAMSFAFLLQIVLHYCIVLFLSQTTS